MFEWKIECLFLQQCKGILTTAIYNPIITSIAYFMCVIIFTLILYLYKLSMMID